VLLDDLIHILTRVWEGAPSHDRSWVYQLDLLCWVDRRNGMLVDDLGSGHPRKHRSEIVEPHDAALWPYPVD
jgi:hypothetical protein